jgi:fibrillarin-like pre-rRNA processing protein
MQETRLKGIFELKRRIYTKNFTPGKTVYDEKLFREGNDEYREWNPTRSKLGAAVLKGASQIGIKPGSIVLYLGAASGTTVSHVSDIVGSEGYVFALDFAPRVVRDLYFVCKDRSNVVPLLEDANKPETYAHLINSVDVVFMDIAQKNQEEIFMKNVNMFLKPGGFGLLALKARSVDVSKNPKQVFREVREKLERQIAIVDYRDLEPFERDHCMFICKKK